MFRETELLTHIFHLELLCIDLFLLEISGTSKNSTLGKIVSAEKKVPLGQIYIWSQRIK